MVPETAARLALVNDRRDSVAVGVDGWMGMVFRMLWVGSMEVSNGEWISGAAGVAREAGGFKVVFDLALIRIPVDRPPESLRNSREPADIKGSCSDGGRANRRASRDNRIEPILAVVARAVGDEFAGRGHA